jgi:hypothetical protein
MTTVALCVLDAIVMKRDDAHGIDKRSHKFFVEVLGIYRDDSTGTQNQQIGRAAGSWCGINWRQS